MQIGAGLLTYCAGGRLLGGYAAHLTSYQHFIPAVHGGVIAVPHLSKFSPYAVKQPLENESSSVLPESQRSEPFRFAVPLPFLRAALLPNRSTMLGLFHGFSASG